MSEPTYRIEIRHEPENELVTYSAYVYSLSDDKLAFVKSGHTHEEALDRAQRGIYAKNHADENAVYLTDDDGIKISEAIPPGFSVRA